VENSKTHAAPQKPSGRVVGPNTSRGFACNKIVVLYRHKPNSSSIFQLSTFFQIAKNVEIWQAHVAAFDK